MRDIHTFASMYLLVFCVAYPRQIYHTAGMASRRPASQAGGNCTVRASATCDLLSKHLVPWIWSGQTGIYSFPTGRGCKTEYSLIPDQIQETSCRGTQCLARPLHRWGRYATPQSSERMTFFPATVSNRHKACAPAQTNVPSSDGSCQNLKGTRTHNIFLREPNWKQQKQRPRSRVTCRLESRRRTNNLFVFSAPTDAAVLASWPVEI